MISMQGPSHYTKPTSAYFLKPLIFCAGSKNTVSESVEIIWNFLLEFQCTVFCICMSKIIQFILQISYSCFSCFQYIEDGKFFSNCFS